ncbi:proline-rich receptor-like protein kinase PERK9 [Iris pallida]|uniref:Proline-rich receptor-like protein kinase PERK9 n=1 Tax=Iris pallida TaxID=29817 RepID=A0AAX6DQG7_IRIPA|nr:proline-rich receptor-like protein kinase PERK9 [Iris pallida]
MRASSPTATTIPAALPDHTRSLYPSPRLHRSHYHGLQCHRAVSVQPGNPWPYHRTRPLTRLVEPCPCHHDEFLIARSRLSTHQRHHHHNPKIDIIPYLVDDPHRRPTAVNPIAANLSEPAFHHLDHHQRLHLDTPKSYHHRQLETTTSPKSHGSRRLPRRRSPRIQFLSCHAIGSRRDRPDDRPCPVDPRPGHHRMYPPAASSLANTTGHRTLVPRSSTTSNLPAVAFASSIASAATVSHRASPPSGDRGMRSNDHLVEWRTNPAIVAVDHPRAAPIHPSRISPTRPLMYDPSPNSKLSVSCTRQIDGPATAKLLFDVRPNLTSSRLAHGGPCSASQLRHPPNTLCTLRPPRLCPRQPSEALRPVSSIVSSTVLFFPFSLGHQAKDEDEALVSTYYGAGLDDTYVVDPQQVPPTAEKDVPVV